MSCTDAGSSPIPDIRRRGAAPLAAALGSAAFLLLAGASAWSLSLALLLLLLILTGAGRHHAARLALVAAAASAATGGGPTGEVLVAVSSLLALAGSDSRLHRLLLSSPIAVLVLTGSLQILPLLAAAAASATLGRPSMRWTMIAAGAAVCLLLNGLPGANREALPITARCITRGEGAVWPDTVTLDSSQPILQMDLSSVSGMDVELSVSAGGVRRHEPVGFLELPDGAQSSIMPGDTVLKFTAPDGPVRLVMSAEWRPFNHPVLRFCGASVTGGAR